MSTLDYELSATTLAGEATTLEPWRGQVLLIVNTASQCGLTPQYEGLQALHDRYASEGLAVLGFPCNQFGAQEPWEEQAISDFCQLNYGVTFPMFSKIDVNGYDAHPIFQQLKTAAPGLLGSTAIKWNFTKFLIGRDGTILRRYAPTTTPEAIAADIEGQLRAAAAK